MKLKTTRITHTFEEESYDIFSMGRPWLKQDGILKSWYSNGQLRYEYPYVNGQEHGLEKCWHSNGQLRYEDLYVYGEQRDIDMPKLEQVIHFGKVLI